MIFAFWYSNLMKLSILATLAAILVTPSDAMLNPRHHPAYSPAYPLKQKRLYLINKEMNRLYRWGTDTIRMCRGSASDDECLKEGVVVMKLLLG